MRFLVAEKLGPHKFKTPEGYLICTDAILSRTGKQEYKRCEIFGDACDEPDKIVNVDRVDAEVFSDKAMASFENKPICIEHPDHDVNAENHNELAVGFVRDVHKGEDNGHPVMMGTLVITDKNAVEAVESGEYKELSCGYDCDINDDDNLQQRNIRGNHVALCKQGRAGIARIVDSANDDLYGLIKEPVKRYYLANKYDKKWDIEDDIVIIAKNISEAEQKLKYRFPDAYNLREISHSDYLKFKRGNIVIDSIEDSEMKDIQATKTPGTDKIIYVMQSDIDKNLYFYIGKTFSMKEGAWGYTKFEMGNTTPEQLKAELTRNGWHQVASGPARVIDTSDAMLSGNYVYFDFAEVKGKSLKQEIEHKYNSKYNKKIKVKQLNKHWVPGKKEVEIQVFADGMHENYDGFWAVVKATEEESKQLKDDWTEVEEENYNKANKAVIDEEYVQLPRGRFKVVAKTEEELKKEGYGYHHSANGYSVYVKNNYAVAIKDSTTHERLFTVEYEQDGVTYIRKVRANSIEDAISKVKDDAHKVVVFTNQVLNELGKNNSIGKYDRVVQAMRSLYSESLLPDDELKTLIRKKVPEYIKKYVKE